MFRRGSVYYTLMGSHCCYCRGGAPVEVWVADHPLGPWKALQQQGSSARTTNINPMVNATTYTVPAQQQSVTVVHGMRPSLPGCDNQGGPMLVWSGDGWQQAPDHSKNHDPEFLIPLCT